MPGKRVYTESEFSAVLKRAAELQRIEGVDDSPGLYLEELQEIAVDVGIDPDHVKRAAFELDEAEPEKGDYWLGGPTDIDLEWIVEGEMSDEKWEDALGEIRRAFSAEGEIRREGRTRDWVHRDQMGGRVHVSMSPARNQTRIRISYGMKEWLWLYVVFLSIGIAPVAVQYALLNLSAWLETGIAVFVMMAFYMVGWLSFRTFTHKQDSKARKLLARLDNLLAEAGTDTVDRVDLIDTSEARRIDDSLLEDETRSEHTSRGRRRERDEN
ncbi:MAG: hypothetical protein HKN37_14920 [Rhodothermales bacterium]|nr:hypothetical protein [Rhodothermales bacterium]